MSDSKDLEILVAEIQKQLSPGAVVQHNVKLPGRTTSASRQIDVLVKQSVGQYEMTITQSLQEAIGDENSKASEEDGIKDEWNV